MLRLVLSTMALTALAGSVFAQEANRPQVSQCQLIAEKIPNVQYANFTPPPSGAPALTLAQVQEDVVITFVGHSTFQIDTPGGISIARIREATCSRSFAAAAFAAGAAPATPTVHFIHPAAGGQRSAEMGPGQNHAGRAAPVHPVRRRTR